MTTIGCIVGSLSQNSINRRFSRYIARRAPAGVTIREISIADLPLYTYDLDGPFPDAALGFKSAVESVDALLFVTSEYNRSIPAALKNALDWGSRPWGDNSFSGRTAAVAGTGLNGAGTAVAQAHLRSVLGYLGTTVVGVPELCLAWSDGILDDDATAGRVDRFWHDLTPLLPARRTLEPVAADIGRGPDEAW